MEKTLQDFENEREDDEIRELFGDDESDEPCGYDLYEARHGID